MSGRCCGPSFDGLLKEHGVFEAAEALAIKEVVARPKIKRSQVDRLRPTAIEGPETRQAIEPMIGHAKSDHRVDRWLLEGANGDALHAISCAAAGYNIRWLMPAIVAQSAKAAKAALLALSSSAQFG